MGHTDVSNKRRISAFVAVDREASGRLQRAFTQLYTSLSEVRQPRPRPWAFLTRQRASILWGLHSASAAGSLEGLQVHGGARVALSLTYKLYLYIQASHKATR